jgi:hypothetical protein
VESDDGRYKVGQSKVKLWQRCHYAYHLKHVERLAAKKVSRPLTFGTTIHKLLEEHAEGRDWRVKLNEIDIKNGAMFRAEVEMYGNLVQDIAYIMEDYEAHYENNDIRYIKINGRKAEHAFELEIEPGIFFIGKIDAVGKWRDHRVLVEHKSFKRKPSEDFRWVNVQSAVYSRVMEILGWKPVDGTLWDYIRSKPPSKPMFLKSGALSLAACDSLPSAFKAFAKENKIKTKDYPSLNDQFKAKRSEWFIRTFTPFSKTIVDNIFDQFVEVARDMRDNHGLKKDKSIAEHCKWCDFAQLCRAELTGSDTDFVREHHYYVEEESHEDEIQSQLDEQAD